MRDYLEELLAGTEDALDQAEAEWTEGVSPPLPRRSRERPEAAGGPAEPERSAGAEEAAGGGENWIETELEGQSRSRETGAVLESGERAEQPEGPAGLRAVLSDRPLEGDGRPPCPGCCGPDGRGVPSLGSGVWGDPRRGPGLCRRSGGRNAPPSGRPRGWRAPDGSRPPWNWPGGQRGTAGSPEQQTGRGRSPFSQDRMSRFSGSMTPHGRWTGSFAGMPGGTTGALPGSERRISIEAGAHALQGLCVASQPKGVLHRL